MIAIVNIGPVRKADPFGEHRYEVRINRAPVCRFTHRRSEGLAKCLRLAADSVAAKETVNLISLINDRTP